MVDGKLRSSPAREALVKTRGRKGSTTTRSLNNSGWICTYRRGIVPVLRADILRPSIWAKNDQDQDRRHPPFSLQGRNGDDGRQRPHSVKVWQASLRTLRGPRISSNHSRWTLQQGHEANRLQHNPP